MPDFDLLIRGAADQPFIGITDGKIAAFGEGSAAEEIDARELLVLPGVIDAHVHFNEPGRTDWEGITTGSRACAAGGTTTFFDMPLNSTPPVVDAPTFHAKRKIAERKSFVDFALWGGLISGNLDELEALRDGGAIGLKAFMSHSGIDDFPMADVATLRAGMRRAAALGLLVAVHAEIDHPELRHGGSVREYLASRPIDIEVEAIELALDLAGETGCALHVVHVSSARGVAAIAAGRARGTDVTCETCPHYLLLTEDDMEQLGAVAKCAPPLRSGAERRALLELARSGAITSIGSDHSPSPMSLKTDSDFFKVWGGISGCQHLLTILHELEFHPAEIARATSTGLSERFRLAPQKAGLRIGADADLVLFDARKTTQVTTESLFYQHRHSPYVGRSFRGAVVRTLLRGRTIFENGSIVSEPTGRFFAPAR